MSERVIEHDKGMVSIDVDSSNPSDETVNSLKDTVLYQELCERIGPEKALDLIRGVQPVEPENDQEPENHQQSEPA